MALSISMDDFAEFVKLTYLLTKFEIGHSCITTLLGFQLQTGCYMMLLFLYMIWQFYLTGFNIVYLVYNLFLNSLHYVK